MILARALTLVALLLAGGAAIASFDERAAPFGLQVIPETYSIGMKRLQASAIELAQEGEIDEAKATARRAIQRSPLEQGPLATLGAIEFDEGEAEAAQMSFLASGALGWRDLATQAYILEQATQTGDATVLAQRIDAILRLGTPYERMSSLVITAEAFDTDFTAFPTRLAASPPWLNAYIIDAGQLTGTALQSRVRILREARSLGMPLNCRPVGWASQQMIESENIASAIATWQGLGCGEVSPTNLGSLAGSFEETGQSSEATTQLRWMPTNNEEIQTSIETAPFQLNGKALHILDVAPGRKLAVQRAINLAEGSYTLQWRDFATTPGAEYSILVDCVTNGRRLSSATAFKPKTNSDPSLRQVNVTVPATDCPGQRIRVFSSSSGQRSDFWLDDFAISAVSQNR